MGTTTSSHEPLDKTGPSPFRRHASCRGTKGERRGGGSSPKRMDRLRRSFRDSFRRRKDHIPESSKPHLWQADEAAVRAGTCTFQVKYLGCVEVFESRGMQVCEEALKVLRNSRRRPVKAVLFVSGDGLRVVEDETKGLIVDQTIEKVSFCAPDRNHDKGFSYICRDGTTRRWMCHGFLALKETGERLSHAVGCAFAACLERKQKRDKECGVTMNFDTTNSTFTRQGSFRQQTLTERLSNENNKNNVISNSEVIPALIQSKKPPSSVTTMPPPPPPASAKGPPAPNPHAIERPHATVSMLVRQGSFRGFNHLNQSSPFKRQLSLRLADLPSNLERTRSHSLEGSADSRAPPLIHLKTPEYVIVDEPQPSSRLRLYSLPTKVLMSPIPESSPLADKSDPVSAMCQQLSQGLHLLSNSDDLQPTQNIGSSGVIKELFAEISSVSTTQVTSNDTISTLTSDFLAKIDTLKYPTNINNNNNNNSGTPTLTPPATPPLRSERGELPRPEQWLGKVAAVASVGGAVSGGLNKRAPQLAHLRAHSLSSADTYYSPKVNGTNPADPFDAEWASLASHNGDPTLTSQRNTNPFLTNSNNSTPVKAFEVQM